MTDSLNTQRVNAAVHVAVLRAISEMTSVGNRQALQFSIGKRLQGTYGAALRALAESEPELNVAELCERVIFAGEYPNDMPEASAYTGDRDRARQSRPNAASPADDWPTGKLAEQPDWADGLEQAKAALSEPVPREPEPAPAPDPAYAAQFDALRAGIDTGRGLAAEARRACLDAAKGTA